MMAAVQSLFSALSSALQSSPTIAIAAAVAWGVFSILLSPCHLASIPLIVGFLNGQGRLSKARTVVISLAFASGILVTVALVGMVTAAAGRMLGDVGRYGNYLVSLLFFAMGLHLLEVVSLPWMTPSQVSTRGRGPWSGFLVGLIFGIALGPCTFAYLAPMIAVTFKVATTNWSYGVLLLLAFGIGHCGVIAVAGSSTQSVQRYLDWNKTSHGTSRLGKVCGVLVVIGGLYLLYSAP